jgi:hypothetical protein
MSIARIFRLALFAQLIMSSAATAGSLMIGVPNDASGACQPFGYPTAILTNGGETRPLSWTPEYQQVYASRAFFLDRHTLSQEFLFPSNGVPALPTPARSRFLCLRHRLPSSTVPAVGLVLIKQIFRQTSARTTRSSTMELCLPSPAAR